MNPKPSRKMPFSMNRRDRRNTDEHYEDELREEQQGLMRSPRDDDHTWSRVSPKFPTHKIYIPRSPTARLPRRLPAPILVIIIVASIILIIAATLLALKDLISVAILRNRGIPPGLWSRNGVLMAGEHPFDIKGFSWYGMEEPAHVPGGLMKTSVGNIFEFAKTHNFNAMRIPLAINNVHANPMSSKGIAAFLNPELRGFSYLDLLRHIIREAADQNILILLDMHRLVSTDPKSNGLWYSADVPQERLESAWVKLCNEFGNEWNVLGADIFNEPWDALWNSSNSTRDWKRASERIGNIIHQACPSWVLFIEGVGGRAGAVDKPPFWSENLRAMQDAPPRVQLSNKVVLSPHVYGPSVYMQNYFKKENFTAGMPAIWDDHFGESAQVTGLATVVGEWGGFYTGKDEKWQNAFYKYMTGKDISFFYWCLNPESGDTGGLLAADWRTPERAKLKLMETANSTDVGETSKHFKHLRNWRP